MQYIPDYHQYVIVIPIYKPYDELDLLEKMCLNRLYDKVFESDKCHIEFGDICYICPEGLDTSGYKALHEDKCSCKEYIEKRFDPKYFTSNNAYSQLLVSFEYYNTFSLYRYMVIFQTDVWLFSADFQEWINKMIENKWEYIGAPIFSNWYVWDKIHSPKETQYRPMVGNGGFSIRDISFFCKVCNPNHEWHKTIEDKGYKFEEVAFEDKFFCNDMIDAIWMNVPSWKTAIKFAIDMNANFYRNYFKDGEFPMGCHAVGKNMYVWKDYVEEFKDNKEVLSFCADKYREWYNTFIPQFVEEFGTQKDDKVTNG